MLKKIIASILIPGLLIQIFGCYSNREILINELKQHKKDDIKLVTKDSTEYSLNYLNKSKENNWRIGDSLIYVTSTKLEPYSAGNLIEKVDTTKIPLSSTKKFYSRSFDFGKTFIAVGVCMVLLFTFLMGVKTIIDGNADFVIDFD